MEFSLDRFYQLNRKAIIWIVLFGLIYLLREFFTLVFLTFIISFFAFPAVRYLRETLRWKPMVSVVVVYLAVLVSYIALYVLVLPNVIRQATSFRARIPDIELKVNELRTAYTKKYPNAARLFNFEIESPMLVISEIGDWKGFVRALQSTNAQATRIRETLPASLVDDLTIVSRSDDDATRSAPSPTAAEADPIAPLERVAPFNPADSNPDPNVDANADRGADGTGAESTASAVDADSPHEPETLVDAARVMESLVAAINERVIHNRDFFRNTDFIPVSERLEGLESVWAEAQTQGRSALSDRECQKLNRRVVERALPIGMRGYNAEKKIDEWVDYARAKVQEYLPNIALYLLKFFGNSLLAILFSFLIVMDYARLTKEVRGLARSKLSDFFVEAGQPVVKFAISVGQGFQAIATIAFITTIMVTIVLFALGISSITFLAVITFLTSLVPVVGIFFEVVPVLLVALNEQGPVHAFWALIALLIIHVIIGYVITPIIFGRRFKLNVVAILFILFIGNQLAGVWGMILGVPIANYLLRDVLGVPSTADEKTQEDSAPGSTEPQLESASTPTSIAKPPTEPGPNIPSRSSSSSSNTGPNSKPHSARRPKRRKS